MTLGNSRAAALAAVMVAAAAGAGVAAADAPADASGRYTMSPVDGGFLRLDKETGAVSMCAGPNGQWVCKPVEDRAVPAAPTGEVAKLEEENKALKERVKALEESLETGRPAPSADGPLAGPPGGKIDLPTEQEVDQALDYMERVYKKLRDRIKDLDKPLPPPADAPPGKTPL